MKNNNIYIFIFLYLCVTSQISAILIDNRYLPLYRPVYERYELEKSVFGSNVFFLLSSKGISGTEQEVDLPDLNGRFNLAEIAKAITISGKENPLPDQWQSLTSINWTTRGKLQAQGLWVGFEKAWSNVSFGLSQYFLHVTNNQRFILPQDTINELHATIATKAELNQALLKANNLLGIKQTQFNKSGLSDLDLYLRFGIVKEYSCRFRKMDLSVTLGTLLPIGPKKDIYIPTSISFGGNGHVGLYVKGDVFLEVKDDWVLGAWFDVLNRFPKTQPTRIPLANEPFNYGASIENVKVKPGTTIGFNPYAAITDLQDGIGFRFGYTLIYHFHDDIYYPKSNILVDVKTSEPTKWIHEFLNFGLTYDFSKATVRRRFEPRLYLYWDLPFGPFGSTNSPKVNRVSVGFEFNF